MEAILGIVLGGVAACIVLALPEDKATEAHGYFKEIVGGIGLSVVTFLIGRGAPSLDVAPLVLPAVVAYIAIVFLVSVARDWVR